MAATFTGAAIQQAGAELRNMQAFQPSRGEKLLNRIGDRALVVSDSQPISATKNFMATTAFTMVKDQVSSFAEKSQILMKVLDEVGKVHPFIQIAVSLFSTAIKMELTRRENNDKVLALNATMTDMMDVLTMLKKVQSPKDPGPEGQTIEDRLSRRMGAICESIKRCAKVCDSYQKHNTAVKILTGSKWQAKFTEVASQFGKHKQGLQFELHIHLSIEMTRANQTLAEVNENVKVMMKMVWEGMNTSEEKEIATLAHGKSLDAVVASDHTLRQILAKQSKGKDEKGGGRPKEASSVDGGALTLAELKHELSQDIDTVLAENSKLFEQKFSAMELSLKETTKMVERQSDRVIEEILAGVSGGPHEHIRDKDIYQVWKLMGWKGSVKATHLVMAIHDHFSEKSGAALKQIFSLTKNGTDTSAEDKLKEIATVANTVIPSMPPEDQWTLEYISVHRVKPLIEAVDDDCSSFASVAEVNTFTASRPEGWSLPRWIAYWTVGFEMTCTWYYYRIRRVFTLIADASNAALPANRKYIGQWMRCYQINYVQDLLAGLRIGEYVDTDWDDDRIFLKFKGYVLDNERKMKTILRRLSYCIDGDNMLNTITGGGRPETYALPVIYLLLERSLWVMNQAQSVVLHPRELNLIRDSFGCLWEPLDVRASKLRSIFYMQNGDPKEKYKRFCFGLLTYVAANPPDNTAFFTDDWSDWEITEHADPHDDGNMQPGLYYGPQTEEFEIQEEYLSSAPSRNTIDSTIAPGSLLGTWSGEWNGVHANKSSASDGLLTVSIKVHTPQGEFSGEGVGAFGKFTIQGQIKGREITFTKKYPASQGDFESTWTCTGTLNEEGDGIHGDVTQESGGDHNDGDADEDEDEDEAEDEDEDEAEAEAEAEAQTEAEGGDEDEDEGGGAAVEDADDPTDSKNGGSFTLSRKPVEYFMCRPPAKEYQENRTQALWKLVRNVSRYWAQRRHLTWDVIKERREKCMRYLRLLGTIRQNGPLPKAKQVAKWSELVGSTHPDDLSLWRSIALFKRLRQTMSTCVCDKCEGSIKKTRLCCFQCSKGASYNSFDLCSECIGESADRASDAKHHIPSHNLLQIRRPILLFEVPQLISSGISMDLLDGGTDSETDSDDRGGCFFCNKTIETRPYWCCVECVDGPYICFECNKQHDVETPWQLQRKPADDGAHDYMHVLILVSEKAADEVGADDRLMALDAKVGVLQGRLDDIESTITTGLKTLGDLLQHLVATVPQPPPGVG